VAPVVRGLALLKDRGSGCVVPIFVLQKNLLRCINMLNGTSTVCFWIRNQDGLDMEPGRPIVGMGMG
jgi:hypothetical protein